MYQGFTVLNEIALFAYFLPLTKNQLFRKSVLKPFIYQELGGLGFFALFMEFHFLTIGVYHTYNFKPRAIKKGEHYTLPEFYTESLIF